MLAKLETNQTTGLTGAVAAQNLERDGPNELLEAGSKSLWLILLEQFTGTMVIVLIVAAVVSLALGEYVEAIAILVIVILNALLGFTQEYRAEKAMAALKQLSSPNVQVKRDGQVLKLPARDLVAGDIVTLEAGNLVSVDGRLLESANLRVQEAALTGESVPVDKAIAIIAEGVTALGDRRNMAYMGTAVSYGRGTMVVTATGMRTELGRLAGLLQSVKREPTPLQRHLEQLGKGLAIAALALVAVVVALGLLRGEELRLMLLTALALAVAVVPEGLATVATITLALGAQRMLKRQALIRMLPAVETLGSVTVICSDKTGTLTQNRMTVTALDVADHQLEFAALIEGSRAAAPPELTVLLAGAALCNDAALAKPDAVATIGDPTEAALIVAADQIGLSKPALETRFPRVSELPFDSDRKRMTTVHRVTEDGELPGGWPLEGSAHTAFTKGATDGLLTVCSQVLVGGATVALSDEWRKRITDAQDNLAGRQMRVLGLAYRQFTVIPSDADLERDLIFVGVIGMIDPLRPEAAEAIKTCVTAGIRTVMITGDHPLTAGVIARELGIGANAQVLTGQDLQGISPEDLSSRVRDVSVYARVSPEDKLRIVEALQKSGELVAMTGDGVNDAPAIKKADIGVAMGVTGTDVAREASAMVLLDDNFATIVAAVKEGRVIFDNIRKFIKYALTGNVGEILTMLVSPLLGMPLPLLPLQILWINLVTDGLPGLALGLEPAEPDTMQRPPHPPKESLFAQGLGRHIAWVGVLIGAVSLVTGYIYWRNDAPQWQTMVFTTLSLSQMAHVLAIRSSRESLFTQGLLSNKTLLGAVLLTIALQMAVIYLPPLQTVFHTQALALSDLGIAFGASMIVFCAVELEKLFIRRRSPPQPRATLA